MSITQPMPGDLIEIFRIFPLRFQHWAVYVGGGYVVHLTVPGSSFSSSGSFSKGSSADKSSDGVVKKEKLDDVVKGDKWRVNNLLDHKYKPRPADDIVREACSLAGTERTYGLLSSNCEHFATRMRYGEAESQQIEEAAKGEGEAVKAVKGAAQGAAKGAAQGLLIGGAAGLAGAVAGAEVGVLLGPVGVVVGAAFGGILGLLRA